MRMRPPKEGGVCRPSAVKSLMAKVIKETGYPGGTRYRPKRLTFNTDRYKHAVSLILEVTQETPKCSNQIGTSVGRDRGAFAVPPAHAPTRAEPL